MTGDFGDKHVFCNTYLTSCNQIILNKDKWILFSCTDIMNDGIHSVYMTIHRFSSCPCAFYGFLIKMSGHHYNLISRIATNRKQSPCSVHHEQNIIVIAFCGVALNGYMSKPVMSDLNNTCHSCSISDTNIIGWLF